MAMPKPITISAADFDRLQPKDRVFIKYTGGFDAGEREFEVGRRSYSKKYKVESKRLYPIGKDGKPIKKGIAKWTLYKRDDDRVSLAHGDMGTFIHEFRMARKENRSCPPGEIRRKGYKRKGYTRKDGTRVVPTRVPSACIEDQGEPGKGPKVFTIEDEGDLGGPGYTDKPTKERQRLMRACVKRKGYRSCLGKLQALAILGKNTWSKKKLAVVERDRKWLVKTFGGPGSFGPEKNPGEPGALQAPDMSEAELMARLKF